MMKALLGKYRFWLNCWGIVFGILAVVFSFYMITFYIGNHDWQFVRYGVKISNGLWEGRLTQFILPVLLLNGKVLPILGAIIGLLFFAGGSVLLARWYQLPQKYFPIIIFSLLITLNPYVCTQLYYVHTVISVLGWHLLSIVGCICAWRFTEKYQIKWLLSALVCLWGALAGYAPSLELISVITVGKFLTDILGCIKINKKIAKKYAILVGIVAAAIICYVLSIYVLRQAKILNTHMYNVQTLAIRDIFGLLLKEWNAPFKTLLMDIPYSSSVMNYLLFLLCGLALYIAYLKKRLVLCIISFIGLFYAAFILAYLSPFGVFKVMRIHSFSVPYIAAVLFAIGYLYGDKFKRNMVFTAAVILAFLYLKADFMAEKVWYLGTEQDERTVDRVRAELLPKLETGKHYRLSSVGTFYGRQKFAGFDELSAEERETYREYYGYGLYLYRFFSAGLFFYEKENPIWGEATYFGNYLNYFLIYESISHQDTINAYVFAKHFGTDKENLIAAADRLCAYPCRNFYYVGQKDILLMVSDDDISRLVLKWNIENEGHF